jgi:hypothetical protein
MDGLLLFLLLLTVPFRTAFNSVLACQHFFLWNFYVLVIYDFLIFCYTETEGVLSNIHGFFGSAIEHSRKFWLSGFFEVRKRRITAWINCMK